MHVVGLVLAGDVTEDKVQAPSVIVIELGNYIVKVDSAAM